MRQKQFTVSKLQMNGLRKICGLTEMNLDRNDTIKRDFGLSKPIEMDKL